MALNRNGGNHDSDVNVKYGGNSFEKHDLNMKAFRRSHAYPVKTATQAGNYLREHNRRITMFRSTHPITEVGASKRKHPIWEMTRPWQIPDMTGEIGASCRAGQWSSLIHIWKIPEHRLSQN